MTSRLNLHFYLKGFLPFNPPAGLRMPQGIKPTKPFLFHFPKGHQTNRQYSAFFGSVCFLCSLGHVSAGSVVFHVALDQMASGLSGDEGQLPSEDRTSNHRGQEPRVRPRGFPVRAFDAE